MKCECGKKAVKVYYEDMEAWYCKDCDIDFILQDGESAVIS